MKTIGYTLALLVFGIVSQLLATYGENPTSVDIDRLINLQKQDLENEAAYDVLITFNSTGPNKTKYQVTETIIAECLFRLKEPFRQLYFPVDIYSKDKTSDKAFTEAVRETQLKLNEKPTGILTWSQFKKVRKIAEQLTETKLYIHGSFSVVNKGETVTAEGALEIVGEEIANPINLHQITADKKSLTCIDRVLILEDSLLGYGRSIMPLETTYEIISWSPDEIVCSTEYNCRTEKLVIGLKTKEVTYITTNRKNTDCDESMRLKSPRISRLVDSSYVQYYADRNREAKKFISNEAKAKLPGVLD